MRALQILSEYQVYDPHATEIKGKHHTDYYGNSHLFLWAQIDYNCILNIRHNFSHDS